MPKYDPNQAPDPQEWLSLDEAERIALVVDYHRRKRIRLPNLRVHATAHVIVENQLAAGESEVVDALARLTADKLDRHDAVHAIAQVLMTTIFYELRGEGEAALTDSYRAKLRTLTAARWLNQELD